jgi:hypothetical protein
VRHHQRRFAAGVDSDPYDGRSLRLSQGVLSGGSIASGSYLGQGGVSQYPESLVGSLSTPPGLGSPRAGSQSPLSRVRLNLFGLPHVLGRLTLCCAIDRARECLIAHSRRWRRAPPRSVSAREDGLVAVRCGAGGRDWVRA